MYLSRLAANKEYEFMKVLYENGFIVPEPFDCSRHAVLMEWIDGLTMKNLRKHPDHKKLYSDLMNFIVKLANHGLIHCDFNEFNIIIRNEHDAKNHEFDFVVIDFPQCVSTQHVDAEAYFNRDVEGIRSFFEKKFRYTPSDDDIMLDTDGYGDGYKYAYPKFKRDVKRIKVLDIEVQASGYSKKDKKKEARDLEAAVQGMREEANEEENDEEQEEEEEEENEDSEEYDSEYDSDEYEEELSDDDKKALEAQTEEENEKIIDALSHGTKNLKMDKLGNYIIDE